MMMILVVMMSRAVVGVELLDGVPVKFALGGTVSYISSTPGTAPIPGYKLSIGYHKHTWVGLKFMTQTSQSNLDVLIVQRTNQPTSGHYKCTLQQYYSPATQPNQLFLDSQSKNDQQALSYSSSNYYELNMYRTRADTKGQDWQGGQFVQICFFTSDANFNPNAFEAQYQSCYGYDVNNYSSVMVGRPISHMNVQGYTSTVYGGIDGPYPSLILFWYLNTPLSQSNELYVRIGNIINSNVGYDYQKCAESQGGDYWGESISKISKDLDYSGYQDGSCILSMTSSSTKITLHRLVYTHDEFDQVITKKINICIIGAHESCQTITLSTLFPIMTVESAVVVWSGHVMPFLLSIIVILCLIY